jgi:glycosyltransferase involved in cell wall biosynthesis
MERYGGAHRYLEALIGEARWQGLECHLVINANDALVEFRDRLQATGTTIHECAMQEGSPEHTARFIDEVIGAVRPRLVHFNSASRHIRQAALRSRALRRRTFATCFTMHAPLVAETSLKGRWGFIPFTHPWRRRREAAQFAMLFDRMISVSREWASHVTDVLRLPAGCFTVIPNGVDPVQYCPVAEREPGNKIVIGGVGNLVEVKRFDVLIEAVALLSTDCAVELRIAGSGRLRAALEELARRKGVGDRVRLVGHLSDMPAFYRSLDLFAMTSDSEAFPYAQLEAMASGLASVVTSVGELPVMVRDGIDGFVIKPGDRENCARRMRELIQNAALRRQFGSSARMRVVAEYSQRVSLERNMAVLREMIDMPVTITV